MADCDHILLLNEHWLYCIVTEEVKFCLLVWMLGSMFSHILGSRTLKCYLMLVVLHLDIVGFLRRASEWMRNNFGILMVYCWFGMCYSIFVWLSLLLDHLSHHRIAVLSRLVLARVGILEWLVKPLLIPFDAFDSLSQWFYSGFTFYERILNFKYIYIHIVQKGTVPVSTLNITTCERDILKHSK